MGGCANSKYAVDEDKEKKPINKENLKKEKRTKKEKKRINIRSKNPSYGT